MTGWELSSGMVSDSRPGLLPGFLSALSSTNAVQEMIKGLSEVLHVSK